MSEENKTNKEKSPSRKAIETGIINGTIAGVQTLISERQRKRERDNNKKEDNK